MAETVARIPGTLDNGVLPGTPGDDVIDTLTGNEPPQKPQIEVLASGLDSPRKLSFGPDGALYVAEAGRGGTGASIPSPSIPGAILSYPSSITLLRVI